MNRVEILKNSQIFIKLSKEQIGKIESFFLEKKLRKEEEILSELSPSNYLGIVVYGKLKVVKFSDSGKETIVEIITPYNLFGAVAVLQKIPYPASAVALEESKVLMITKDDFFQILSEFPFLWQEVAILIGRRLKNSIESLQSIASEKVEKRIVKVLLKYAACSPSDEVPLQFHLTKQAIADMAGTTVETVIRTMSRFKKDGVIRYDKQDTKLVYLKKRKTQEILES